MKVVIGADHAGIELKNAVVEFLRGRDVEVEDVGTHGNDSVDYPDFASTVSAKVGAGAADFGVLVCGTGLGMAIVANKYRGVRAVPCTSEFAARAARAHNDANVLCLGERLVGTGLGVAIAEAFFGTSFEGGRHERRTQKIADVESENMR